MPSPQMQHLVATMKKMMTRGLMPAFGKDINPEVLRATIETAQKNMPLQPGVSYKALCLGGVECELCTPEGAGNGGIIFYIHGGGLICGNAFTSRGYAGVIGSQAKLPVYTVSYRLAPQHPFPAAVQDCLAVYKEILLRHKGLPIFLIGESGGGYLSLTTALKCKEQGLQMPAGIIPYSPVADMSGTLDRSKNNGKDLP